MSLNIVPPSTPVLPSYSRDVLGFEAIKNMLKTHEYLEFREASLTGKALSKALANKLAKAIYDWAVARGVLRFAHVFNPCCRPPAFKYNSFALPDFKTSDWTSPLDFVDSLSGSMLLFSETDGSSFPAGGLRVTHQAAAYLSWDKTSPCWIKGDTLFIPSASITYAGDANDEKTPLLRSLRAIDKEATRLLHLLGYKDVKHVVCNVGCEQEFYLVDRELFLKRPDLVNCGRTLLGVVGPNNQQLSDNYFAEPNRKVQNFFREFQKRSMDLGISYVVGHNEVGPSQHEWSPSFTLVNIAADQNNLSMQLMQEVANNNGLAALLHEKPYKGVNGSGKHNNWGLNTDTGKNLYVQGDTPEDQKLFVAMVATLARAIFRYGDLLRLGVATPSNDHRLGAHEAPPAIMSIYLGQGLTEFLRKASEGGPLHGYSTEQRYVNSGTNSVGPVPTMPEDRNRTAPFPWCGNRFEFRAVGSSQNVMWPCTLLQAIVADSVKVLADNIEASKDVDGSIRNMLKENFGAIFVGDGYSEEWHNEAVKRGLSNLRDTPSAVDILSSPANQNLLSNMGVLTPKETQARQQILYDNYTTVQEIEAKTLLQMVNRGVLPACSKDLALTDPLLGKDEKAAVYTNLRNAATKLQEALKGLPQGDSKGAAHYAKDQVKPAMAKLRAAADASEELISLELYPYPTYQELWYNHHWD
jgi:glutamine synthetase